jgi:hypothetical protein
MRDVCWELSNRAITHEKQLDDWVRRGLHRLDPRR